MTRKIKSIAVQIGDYAYDWPVEIPLPRIGEKVSICDSGFAIVDTIHYQIFGEWPNNNSWMITIYTRED